ncbi:MAG: hypothetical protein FJW21_08210 [Acidimicrobiia bacterium]|nr:hypothetical protein [Acidimicrobiia bacterium]
MTTPLQPNPLRTEEFAALRATIRERGTLRVSLVVATIIAWATLCLVTEVWIATPVATLIPLLVLAAGFEATFALHVGVERIGRYLQVKYEGSPDSPSWEHTAMRFGTVPGPAAGTVDPLFSSLFIFATTLNIVSAVLSVAGVEGGAIELFVFSLVHLAFVIRIVRARAYAAAQRTLDLAALKSANPT